MTSVKLFILEKFRLYGIYTGCIKWSNNFVNGQTLVKYTLNHNCPCMAVASSLRAMIIDSIVHTYNSSITILSLIIVWSSYHQIKFSNLRTYERDPMYQDIYSHDIFFFATQNLCTISSNTRQSITLLPS